MLDQRFINGFSLRLTKLLGEQFSLADLFSSVDSRKIVLTNFSKKDKRLECPWVNEFEKTIINIKNIIANPRMHLKAEKHIAKTELAARIDNQGFVDTLKESRLWRKGVDRPRPNYVYNTYFEDDITIMENLYVCGLVDKMYRIVIRYHSFVSAMLENYKKKLFSNKINMFNVRFLRTIESVNVKSSSTVKSDLTYINDPVGKMFKRLNMLRIQLNRIRSTTFYETCNSFKKLDLNSVVPTRLLTDVKDYFRCFQLWNYIRKVDLKIETEDYSENDYSNFIIVRILNVIKNMGYENTQKLVQIKYIENKLRLDETIFVKNNVKLMLRTNKNGEIIIKAELLYGNTHIKKEKGLAQLRISRYCIKPIAEIEPYFKNDTSVNLVLERVRKELFARKECDNIFIVTPNEDVVAEDAIFKINSYDNNMDSILSVIINSFSMITNADAYVYSVRCPVCGSNIVEETDKDYKCAECNSKWSIFVAGSKNNVQNVVWLKRFY